MSIAVFSTLIHRLKAPSIIQSGQPSSARRLLLPDGPAARQSRCRALCREDRICIHIIFRIIIVNVTTTVSLRLSRWEARCHGQIRGVWFLHQDRWVSSLQHQRGAFLRHTLSLHIISQDSDHTRNIYITIITISANGRFRRRQFPPLILLLRLE